MIALLAAVSAGQVRRPPRAHRVRAVPRWQRHGEAGLSELVTRPSLVLATADFTSLAVHAARCARLASTRALRASPTAWSATLARSLDAVRPQSACLCSDMTSLCFLPFAGWTGCALCPKGSFSVQTNGQGAPNCTLCEWPLLRLHASLLCADCALWLYQALLASTAIPPARSAPIASPVSRLEWSGVECSLAAERTRV